MTDHRQCGRCGRTDAIPGTAIDSTHDCPHGVRCEVRPMTLDPETIACVTCNLARLRRKVAAEERRATAIESLPGARIAFGLERP